MQGHDKSNSGAFVCLVVSCVLQVGRLGSAAAKKQCGCGPVREGLEAVQSYLEEAAKVKLSEPDERMDAMKLQDPGFLTWLGQVESLLLFKLREQGKELMKALMHLVSEGYPVNCRGTWVPTKNDEDKPEVCF